MQIRAAGAVIIETDHPIRAIERRVPNPAGIRDDLHFDRHGTKSIDFDIEIRATVTGERSFTDAIGANAEEGSFQ